MFADRLAEKPPPEVQEGVSCVLQFINIKQKTNIMLSFATVQNWHNRIFATLVWIQVSGKLSGLSLLHLQIIRWDKIIRQCKILKVLYCSSSAENCYMLVTLNFRGKLLYIFVCWLVDRLVFFYYDFSAQAFLTWLYCVPCPFIWL